MKRHPESTQEGRAPLVRKTADITEEREAQLKESLEIVNKLLDSSQRNHVVDSIREILRKRS